MKVRIKSEVDNMQREEEVVYLYLDDIIPNRFQPREVFDEKPLKELAVSIKEHGVIQPIIVRKVEDKYEIIAGERRYKASALAGLTKIPAIIRDLDDKETSKVALLENLQRRNLNPVEEAKTYQKILELDQMTQDELAKTMGKSQSAVANKLRLLALPEEIQEALLKERISERHARSLLNLESAEKQKEMLKKIIDNKMTVRQVEEEIKGKTASVDTTNENKGQGEVLEISMNNDIPSELSFIPDNPLMPNLNGETADTSTPILTSIPTNIMTQTQPSTDTKEEESTNKFINFGEIKKETIDEADESERQSRGLFFQNPNPQPFNVDTMKENAMDINSPAATNNDSSSTNLDSLLNIAEPIPTDDGSGDDFQFFSPAKEAIEESEKEEKEDNEDYFQEPDLIPIDLPNEVEVDNVESVSLNSDSQDGAAIIMNSKSDLNQAIDKLRECIKEVEALGLKVDYDEMSLDKSYQVIIKIEK